MSPLVRSLLALAALLAAADAQYHCVTATIGQTSPYSRDLSPADFPYGRAYLQVPNYCDPPMQVVGELVTACNKSPEEAGYPTITPPPDGQVTPVTIDCPDHSGCIVYTKEYCY